MAESEGQFDPSQSEDPVAQKVAWGPLNYGGSSYRTHYLHFSGTERAEFKALRRAQLLAGILLAAGVIISLGFVGARLLPNSFPPELDRFVVLLFGLLFIFGGAVNFYLDNVPIVFDKGKAYYWKSRKRLDQIVETEAQSKAVELKDIYAIQLLAEMLLSRRRWFRSYELNLILASGKRVNVVDHSDLDAIREDAERLGEFLDVPVWDVIDSVEAAPSLNGSG